jgi:hypothetical protein
VHGSWRLARQRQRQRQRRVSDNLVAEITRVEAGRLCRFFDLPTQTLLRRIAALRNNGTQIATPAGGPAAPTPQPPTRMSTMTAVMRLAGTIVVVVAALPLVAT